MHPISKCLSLDRLFSRGKKKKKERKWITDASACLVGIWLKGEHENMRQSTDKCHEAFPNQTISGFTQIIWGFFHRKLNRTTLAKRYYIFHGMFYVGK